MRRKDNYAMIRRITLKRVTLPNGKTFVARSKRVSRAALPPRIKIRRRYRSRPARGRNRQAGRGIVSVIKNCYHSGKKLGKNYHKQCSKKSSQKRPQKSSRQSSTRARQLKQ